WEGQVARMALEQGIALTGRGVEYLDARQTELILIPGS
ncbi:MAG: putative Xaa-Pro aminopeptidase, partial [Frankiales bacterium]|nr:putative Xaa-Pro aminopeptidase [Frankiales bacterium]